MSCSQESLIYPTLKENRENRTQLLRSHPHGVTCRVTTVLMLTVTDVFPLYIRDKNRQNYTKKKGLNVLDSTKQQGQCIRQYVSPLSKIILPHE